MARGANMNVVDNSGSTALTLALRRKMPDELVFVLIHAPGIKLDVFDRLTGNLALVTAVLDNRLNLATAMLQAGASPSARNRGKASDGGYGHLCNVGRLHDLPAGC